MFQVVPQQKQPIFMVGVPGKSMYRLYSIGCIAQCVLCSIYFSAQPNKLRPILKFEKYYPIEHIFVPACSSARKIHFFKF